MSAVPELPEELGDLGKAIGLLNGSGGVDNGWFDTPLDKLRTILSDGDQRDALLRLLDALLPPSALTGIPINEKWHPLLGLQPRGNVYLTVLEDSGGVTVGVAGQYGAPAVVGNITAELSGSLPLVKAGASVEAIAGSASGPLNLHLRVNLGWQRPTEPIGLQQSVTQTAGYYDQFSKDIGVGTDSTQGATPVDHPYVDDSGVVWIRPNQKLTLTLLVEPHTVVHATTGLVPRKEIGMRREWVAAALAKLAPTFRFGPVLVDPKRIRMPVASELHGTWSWSHRIDASTWAEDPVINSQGDARLSPDPAQGQEGLLKMTPVQDC